MRHETEAETWRGKHMRFIQSLKEIKWDLEGRHFLYEQAIIGWIPSLIGYRLRRWFYRKWLKSLGEETIFMEGIYIRNPQNLSIGKRCSIGVGVRIQAAAGLIIGDDVILGPGVGIWTSNHGYREWDKPIREQQQEMKEVYIGDDVWIGTNAFIMPGAYIPRGCVISAGAVVAAKRYTEFSILAGNPARLIGSRKPSNQNNPLPLMEK